jgi:hypothetical protein
MVFVVLCRWGTQLADHGTPAEFDRGVAPRRHQALSVEEWPQQDSRAGRSRRESTSR